MPRLACRRPTPRLTNPCAALVQPLGMLDTLNTRASQLTAAAYEAIALDARERHQRVVNKCMELRCEMATRPQDIEVPPRAPTHASAHPLTPLDLPPISMRAACGDDDLYSLGCLRRPSRVEGRADAATPCRPVPLRCPRAPAALAAPSPFCMRARPAGMTISTRLVV